MNKSPLQLEGYYVSELMVKLRTAASSDVAMTPYANLQPRVEVVPQSPLTFDVSTNYQAKEEDPSRHAMEMSVRSNLQETSSYPYDFQITITGFFRWAPDEPLSADILKAVRTNGLSMLYSIAREIISTSTARGPFPGALLPTVSFAGSPLLGLPNPGSELTAKKASVPKGKRTVSRQSVRGSKKKG